MESPYVKGHTVGMTIFKELKSGNYLQTAPEIEIRIFRDKKACI